MPKQLLPALCAVALVITLFNACDQRPSIKAVSRTEFADSATAQYGGFSNQVAWGAHLVNEHGCKGCHTPKKMTPRGAVMDSALLLSGHPAQMPPPDIDRKLVETKHLTVSSEEANAWVGKWGISYAANLTPDATGIGNWKEENLFMPYGKAGIKVLPVQGPYCRPCPGAVTAL